MNSYANPSIDPANYDSLTGAFREIFKKLMQSIDGVLPAQVINYDRAKRRAQIQISISMINTNGDVVPRGQIDNVLVWQFGSGHWVIDAPIPRGQSGWLIACDRDISLFSQNGQVSAPNTKRMKSFSDSVFIPDVFSDYVSTMEDKDDMVIQSLTGQVKILLGNTQIKISAPNVIIESPNATVNATNANINATSMVTMTTPLLAVSGDIKAGGTITPGA